MVVTADSLPYITVDTAAEALQVSKYEILEMIGDYTIIAYHKSIDPETCLRLGVDWVIPKKEFMETIDEIKASEIGTTATG